MIRIIKLMNGETIIGEVDGDFSEFYNIYDPFVMVYVNDNMYGNGFKLNYLLEFSEKNYVTIRNSMVIYDYIPSKSVHEYYIKLVKYKNENDPSEMIQKTIEEMEDMDTHWRKLLSRRIRGDEDLN